MSNLEIFIEELRRELSQFENLSEDDIARYIYIKLGRKIVFDTNFVYGKQSTKKEIYKSSGQLGNAEKSKKEDRWSLICRDIAKIYAYIGKKFGLNISEVKDEYVKNYNEYPHVWNKITRKDGSIYYVDLQQDLKNIQNYTRTKFFGMKTSEFSECVFTQKEIEKIDMKLGVISHKKYYSSEYIDLLKYNMPYFKTLFEQMKFVIENILAYPDESTGYDEQSRYTISVIRECFTQKERQKCNFNFIDCYYIEDGNRTYRSLIEILDKGRERFFIFQEGKGYIQITIDELAKEVKNGLKIPRKIQGLAKAVQALEGESK